MFSKNLVVSLCALSLRQLHILSIKDGYLTFFNIYVNSGNCKGAGTFAFFLVLTFLLNAYAILRKQQKQTMVLLIVINQSKYIFL